MHAVGGAAALALENERLTAELRATVSELRASRARIVESADAARRKIERDLHDGAQQRLVALALSLRLARARVDGDPAAAGELLDGAAQNLEEAIRELRELARGIHPAVLTDRGLGSALEALAQRMPLPIEIAAVPDERLPAPVEAAAYFVVAEAITNVARYAQASHASRRRALRGRAGDRDRRRRRGRRRRPGQRVGPARAQRPDRRAGRAAGGLLAGRARNDRPRLHSALGDCRSGST